VQNTTNKTSTVSNLEIPNAQLYWGQDRFGNHIQALVPFGCHAEPTFEDLHADWDGAKPVLVAIVHASSIRALLADAEAYADSRVHPDKDFDPTPF
jgi:hypothetical protein